jgi:hypothetical protein
MTFFRATIHTYRIHHHHHHHHHHGQYYIHIYISITTSKYVLYCYSTSRRAASATSRSLLPSKKGNRPSLNGEAIQVQNFFFWQISRGGWDRLYQCCGAAPCWLCFRDAARASVGERRVKCRTMSQPVGEFREMVAAYWRILWIQPNLSRVEYSMHTLPTPWANFFALSLHPPTGTSSSESALFFVSGIFCSPSSLVRTSS